MRRGGCSALRYSLTMPAGALRICPKLPPSWFVGFDSFPRAVISFASRLARVRTLFPSVSFVLLPAFQTRLLAASFLNPPPFLIGTPALYTIFGSLGNFGSDLRSTILLTCVVFSFFSLSRLALSAASSSLISRSCSFL